MIPAPMAPQRKMELMLSDMAINCNGLTLGSRDVRDSVMG
jgi:hypothetical protein